MPTRHCGPVVMTLDRKTLGEMTLAYVVGGLAADATVRLLDTPRKDSKYLERTLNLSSSTFPPVAPRPARLRPPAEP